MAAGLTADQEAFYEQFTTRFFSVDGVLQVSEAQRQEALAMAGQADENAALQCMTAFGRRTAATSATPRSSTPLLEFLGR
jgi:hypothetical protein